MVTENFTKMTSDEDSSKMSEDEEEVDPVKMMKTMMEMLGQATKERKTMKKDLMKEMSKELAPLKENQTAMMARQGEMEHF